MQRRTAILLRIAFEAGHFLKKSFGRIGVVQAAAKGGMPLNLVSEADMNSQRMIVERIRRHFPGDAFLAEEGDLSRLGPHLSRGPLWVIDPLDGTVNFLHGFPLFAVSIAFCMDAQPQIGAIYIPAYDEFFWAQKGKGAWLSKGKTPFGSGRRLHVSRAAGLSDSLMITGFGYDRAEKADFYLAYYRAFLKVCHDVRRTGAACVDLAWIAAGRADGFWEWKLNPWDVAAGALLVEEAGGRISHFNKKPYCILNSEQTLATNGKIHNAALSVIRGASCHG